LRYNFIQTVSSMIVISISVLAIMIMALVIVLLLYSPGKPEPFLDQKGILIAGSVSEKISVTIGGIRQGMIIQSKKQKNKPLNGQPAKKKLKVKP